MDIHNHDEIVQKQKMHIHYIQLQLQKEFENVVSCAHSLTNNGQLSSAMNGVGFGPFLLLDYHY